jgi:hypothetical protein
MKKRKDKLPYTSAEPKSVREAYVHVAVIDNEVNAGKRDIYLMGV